MPSHRHNPDSNVPLSSRSSTDHDEPTATDKANQDLEAVELTESGTSESGLPDGAPGIAEIVGRLDRLWAEQLPESPSPFATLAGSQIGKYTIERVIGRGGFGIVYKARDQQLQRDVALKIPRPEVLIHDEKLRRFEAEALATAHLDHPSIVPLYEADLAGATPYLASAYCSGPNLQQWLDEAPGAQPAAEAARFVSTLAEAVHYAHNQGVVHRDLKPSNVLLMPVAAEPTDSNSLDEYEPRLTDFGLSWFAESALTATHSSIRLGTPLYMAPEQATGKSGVPGAASDIYSLGVLLYRLITGKLPFNGSSEFEIVQQILTSDPVAPSKLNGAIHRDLSSICLKCLEKEPQRRYVSAAVLQEDIQRFLRGEPTVARPITLFSRSLRWLKRSPTRAALLLFSIAAVTATVAGLSFHVRTVNKQAIGLEAALREVKAEREVVRESRNQAEEARRIADVQRQLARETSYRSDMRLAFELFERGQVNGVRQLLADQLTSDGVDLRSSEWFVLNANLNALSRVVGRHDGAATECALSPDRTTAYSVGVDGFLRGWDLATGNAISEFNLNIGELHAIAVSPDGTTVAVGGATWLQDLAHVILLNAKSGEQRSTFQTHETTIESIEFSPDGRWLAAGSRYQPVQLTRLSDEKTFTLPAERRNRSLSFSHDSRYLAIGATSTRVDIWSVDQETPEKEREVPGVGATRPYIVQFAPHDLLLATAYVYADYISLFEQPVNIPRGFAMEANAHVSSTRMKSLSFSPRGELLGAGDESGATFVWRRDNDSDVESQRIEAIASLSPHDTTVSSLHLIDEENFISTGEDGRVCVSSPFASGAVHQRWEGIVVKAAVVADNDLFLGCDDGTIRRLTHAFGRRELERLPFLAAEEKVASKVVPDIFCTTTAAGVEAVVTSPDGRTIAVATTAGGVRIYDRTTGAVVRTIAPNLLDRDDVAVSGLSYSANGNLLGYSAREGYAHILDLKTGRDIVKHDVGNGYAIRFLKDDAAIAVACRDDRVEILELPGGNVLRSVFGAEVYAMESSPNGELLACALGGGRIWMVDVESGDVKTVSGHKASVSALKFTSNGRTLVSLDSVGFLQFVDAASGAAFGGYWLPDRLSRWSEYTQLLSGENWLAAIVAGEKRATDVYFWGIQCPAE